MLACKQFVGVPFRTSNLHQFGMVRAIHLPLQCDGTTHSLSFCEYINALSDFIREQLSMLSIHTVRHV